RFATRVSLRHQVLSADGQDDPIDRAAFPVFLQQLEELDPACAVGVGVGILRRVTTCRVEEDSLVGEPPVTVACAADTAQRAFAGALFKWEMQSRIDQCCRLSRTGRADDDVPRQVVQTVAGSAPLLEDRNRLFEAFAELYCVGTRSGFGTRLLHDRRN